MLLCTHAVPEMIWSPLGAGFIWGDRFWLRHRLCGWWVPHSPVLCWVGVIWQCLEGKLTLPTPTPPLFLGHPEPREIPSGPKFSTWSCSMCLEQIRHPGWTSLALRLHFKSNFLVTLQRSGEKCSFPDPGTYLQTVFGVRFHLYVFGGVGGQSS